MRVAQRMISRNYMKTMNTSLSKRAESFERGTSGLKFSRLSDNVADGSRAMHIQEERYKSTQQLNNVENLLSEMNSVDSNMDSIHSIMQSIQEKTLAGMSENYGPDKRAVLAQEIASKKEQILQFANAQFSGKYLFSGTNNSTPPFTSNPATGKLQFNGVDVELIEYKNGGFVYTDPTDGVEKPVPHSDDIFADTGLGLKISNDTEADPRTAFKVSFSGLKMLGFGPEVPGKELDRTAMDDLHRQLVDLTDQVGMSRTDLGTRMDFLDRTKERLEDDIDNMSEMESKLVSSDPADEAIKMKECEYVWMAVLQLGSQILPSSLLDFMR